MRDSEIVASIVAGEADRLAEAYDRYADALFGYCRSLLREPADAADAVQDTFVIAASRLAGLRDPELLRPWLYAVARNECLRRLGSRGVASALDEAPEAAEQADETADVGAEAERAETRALLRSALGGLGGLNPAERDVVTQLLHGLDVAEIAPVLDVSRNHVHALLARAREQLGASVGVLLVARSARQDCAVLDSLFTGWDGQLTCRCASGPRGTSTSARCVRGGGARYSALPCCSGCRRGRWSALSRRTLPRKGCVPRHWKRPPARTCTRRGTGGRC